MSELTELKSFLDDNFRTFCSYMIVIFLLSLFCFVLFVEWTICTQKMMILVGAVPEEADLNPGAKFMKIQFH